MQSCFNGINKKYQRKRKNKYLEHLIEPSFQGLNRLLVLLFENETDRVGHTGYYHPIVETKDYNVTTNYRNFFDQPIRNNIKAYKNIRKIATA